MSVCSKTIFYEPNGLLKVRIGCTYEGKETIGSESYICLYWRNNTKPIDSNALPRKDWKDRNLKEKLLAGGRSEGARGLNQSNHS